MDSNSGYGSNNSDYAPVLNSICPAGWRLPRIDYDNNNGAILDNEFDELNTLYNAGSTISDSGLTTAPLSMMKVGLIEGGELDLNAANMNGSYWFSTGNNEKGFTFTLGNGEVNTSDIARASGANIRCVLR